MTYTAAPERAAPKTVTARRPVARTEWTPDPAEPGVVRPSRKVVSAPVREVDRTQLWVHPNDQHPNHEAHAIAAQGIEQGLRAQGAVPR